MNRQTGRIEGQLPPSVTAEEVIRGVDLRGRRAIVTGGASGIGQAIAGALVGAGAQVVIAGRNTQAGDDAANRINAAAGADLATADLLDLGSLESVRDFARRRAGEPLDLLINNAGVMACPLGWTIASQAGLPYGFVAGRPGSDGGYEFPLPIIHAALGQMLLATTDRALGA